MALQTIKALVYGFLQSARAVNLTKWLDSRTGKMFRIQTLFTLIIFTIFFPFKVNKY